MNAAESIQGAIDKLTRLRDETESTRWHVVDRSAPDEEFARYGYDIHGENDWRVTQGGMSTVREGAIADLLDADLIVTLHATIDTQVKVLEVGLRFVRLAPGLFTEAALDLANAILGEQVPE